MTARCPICQEPVPEGHNRTYCGPRCKKAAEVQRRRARRVEEFTAAAADIPKTGDRAEVLALLMVAAKLGSVTAAKILLDELRRDEVIRGDVVPSVIDELASRRRPHET
jgi:predicted nucleic acid-binding Zn ribbon protein